MTSPRPWKHRHALSTALALALLAMGARPAAAETYGFLVDPNLSIPRVTSFGDSYSKLRRVEQDPVTGRWVRIRNYLEQPQAEGQVKGLAGYGESGATAANVTVNGKKNSFSQQIDRWVAAGGTFGSREATTVFFGYNDINHFSDLTRSQEDYKAGVKRLISRGANSGDRRVFLFLAHDWGKNPAQKGDPNGVYRARTKAWNSGVTAFAKTWSKKNVVAVDLFTAFENVFASPATYGLTNVTTVDLANSATTALYADANHFGEKGQDIIQQVFLSYASRAWGYSAVAATSAKAVTRLGQDIGQGLALGIASLPEAQRLGLNAFAVGELGAEQAPTTADGDPTRAGFVQAYHPDERPDGGLGVNYAFSPDTSVGVVIGRYGEGERADLERASASASVVADSVSAYLDHKAHGFGFRTRITVSDEDHLKAERDGLTGQVNRARFDGRTTEVAQRVGYDIAWKGATWTPWAELSRRVQELGSFTIGNPYISDVTYSGTEAGETMAWLGLDVAAEPWGLGAGRSLELFGGVSYGQSLARDDWRVTISEAAGLVPDQEETIRREQLREIGLHLGAALALGERLSLTAALGLAHDLDQGSEQEATIRLRYRFD